MTLAELKRRANKGNMKLELVERYGSTEIIERLRGVRDVLRANSVALILKNADGAESELRIESAKLIDFTDNSLIVYAPAERECTAEEKSVLDEWIKIRDEYEKRNPYCNSYWKMKSYFENCSCPWMEGFDTISGKRYQTHNGKVRDNSIKGEAILKYRVSYN